MSFDAAIAVVASCSLALGLGCAATVQPIHRPPTLAEIREINAPEAPVYVEPLPRAGWGDYKWRVAHVVLANPERIVVAPEEGAPFSLHLDDVANFHLRRTGHGAAIGAGVGAAIGFVGGFFTAFYISRVGDPGPPGRPQPGAPATPRDTSSAFPDGPTFLLAVAGAVGYGAVGALIGAIAGSPEDFPVVLGPAPLSEYGSPTLVGSSAPADERAASVVAPSAPPADERAASVVAPSPPPADERAASVVAPSPPPADKRAASVVALSAEVRSAPFKVAPVVVVLAQGKRLFVEAAPREGWRVVYLSDGRVGYVQDAQVKMDSP